MGTMTQQISYHIDLPNGDSAEASSVYTKAIWDNPLVIWCIVFGNRMNVFPYTSINQALYSRFRKLLFPLLGCGQHTGKKRGKHKDLSRNPMLLSTWVQPFFPDISPPKQCSSAKGSKDKCICSTNIKCISSWRKAVRMPACHTGPNGK